MSFTQQTNVPVISADENVRARFMVQVYQHLALAIVAFIAFETALFITGGAEGIYNFVFGGRSSWMLVLGGFMLVSFISSQASHKIGNPAIQYAALFGLAAAYAVLFAPMLHYMFKVRDQSSSVGSAAAITLIGFAGLTVIGLTTKKDLSFMRPLIMWGGFVALGLIVAALIFQFSLGPIFSVAMIGLAGASILYQTQSIMRQYPTWAYVGAAVSLFGSVMTMFYYILNLFMRR